MSQIIELELLKEIPGYKTILKSVIKTQMQLLIEQLCDQTGEESIILTASINEGTLSHLGSNMGKGFFEGRDELKSQFLVYCLKNCQNTVGLQPRKSPARSTVNSLKSPASTPIHENSNIPTIALSSDISAATAVVKVEDTSDSRVSSCTPMEDSTTELLNIPRTVTLPSSVSLSHTQTQSSETANGDELNESNVSGTVLSEDPSLKSSIKVKTIMEGDLELKTTENVPLKTELIESSEQNEVNDTISISSNSSFDCEENEMNQEMQGDKENSQDEHTRTETESVPSVHDNDNAFDELTSINSLQVDVDTVSTEKQLAKTSMISENDSETAIVDKQTDLPPLSEKETDTSNDSETTIVDKQADIPPLLENETDTVEKAVLDTADVANPYSSSVIENYLHTDSEKLIIRIERVDASQTALHKTDDERNTQEILTNDQEQNNEIDKDNVRKLQHCTVSLRKCVEEPSGRKDYDPKCIKCHQMFSWRSEKESHEKKCFSDRVCSICGYTGRHRTALEDHMVTHTGEKRYSCPKCNMRFKWRSTRISHVSKCSRSRRENKSEERTKVEKKRIGRGKVNSCKGLDFKKGLKVIPRRLHTTKSDRKCKYCGKVWLTPSRLREHLPVHTGEKNFSCSECGLKFKWRSLVKPHEKKCGRSKGIAQHTKLTFIKTAEKITGSSCKLCGKIFSSEHYLEQHVLRHTNIKPFPCIWCLMRFKSSESLENHQKFNCAERKLFDSKQVEETYTKEMDKTGSLTAVHRGGAMVFFPCKTCGQKFKFRKSLEVHMESRQCKSNNKSTDADDKIDLDSTQLYTNDDNSIVMKDLGNTVMKKEINRRLIKNTIEQRIHPCPVCLKKFTRKDTVEKHLKLHFGVSHFTCKYCNSNFKSFATLNNHKVVAHSRTDKSDKQRNL